MDDSSTISDFAPPMRGMELVARSSIHSLRPPSITSTSSSNCSEAHIWKLTDLRKRFKNKNLETLYLRYQQRLMHVDLKGFLLLQIFLSSVFILILLCINTDDESRALPEIIGHVILLLTASLCYGVAYRERRFKKYQFLSMLMAVVLTFVLVSVDLAQDLWFAHHNTAHPDEAFIFHVPAALYTILAVYNLLPIASLRVTTLIGFLVAIVHVTANALLFQTRKSVDNKVDISLIMADVAFYLTANVVGIFTKCLNETTLRRAFLDRRRCIESTIKLDYEKSQEEQLMLSILPKHIAHLVGTDIREEVQLMTRSKTSPSSRKPFDKLHVETHKDVSVLYADIVNFTPLTAALSAASLVSMLNELFGKFDEAAKENDCLRIKILGDCYYCVSGIQDGGIQDGFRTTTNAKNNAKNCVEMGFKMIEIIRQVREDHQVDVDMRIGVHSGNVISGLIGLRKWQFDIWSRDVTIANHMEQSGIPGYKMFLTYDSLAYVMSQSDLWVHISMATKNLLGDSYQFRPGNGMKRDPYLAKLGIETFLVVSTDTNQSKESGVKRIKFKADPFATLPRMNANASVTNDGASTNNHLDDSETNNKLNNDTKNSSLDSLYERLPPSLPVVVAHRIPPSSSLPHIYTKMRQSSLATGDEHSEEIYIRLVKNPRKSSVASGTGRRLFARRRSTTGENTSRRGAVLMDNTLVSFRRMMDQADSKMEKSIESMILSKFRRRSRETPDQESHVNLLLFFSNRSWELPFLQRPDPLFNLYVLGAIPVLIGIMTIQLSLYSSGPRTFWLAFGIALIIVVLVGMCLWVPQIWYYTRNSINDDPENVFESLSVSPEPSRSSSTVSAAFFKLDSFCSSLTTRTLIFLVVTVAVGACGLVDLDHVKESNNTSKAMTENNTLFGQCNFQDSRIYLWYFTFVCALTMSVAFGFYRIHFALKFSFYAASLAIYTVMTVNIYPDICLIYSREECLLCKASPSVQPELSHALYLLTILMILHVADRQIEFINRLDYVWQRQLANEQEEANTTRIVNKMLLLNILPHHVADVYLDTSRCSDQLYHEEHKRVAVMFASIPNFMDYFAENDIGDGGYRCLEVLNSIISAFDAFLFEESFSRIEKIKIVGSTYMAASGLTAVRNGSTAETVAESESRVIALITMIRFALAMCTVLDQLNRKQAPNFQLRIGIEYGPVIAGVVGAQKPLYDIWGDTVNMASRLEYTSQLGEIQVTEKTAKLLEAVDIHCEKRGETFLKGKGLVMTYWVRPDASDFYDSVQSSSAAIKSFLGLSDMLLTSTSARSSLSRKPGRPSVLIEEDEEERSSQKDAQHLSSFSSMVANTALTSPPLVKFKLYEDVDTVSLSNEDVNLDIYDEDEMTHL